MSPDRLRSRAVAPVLLCCCVPWLVSGCSVWNTVFHHSHDNRCTEKPFQGNTINLAGLKAPEGLTAPEQRNQIKIPKLDEPDHPRPRNAPCLSQPPSYSSGSSIALPTRTGLPMGAPAPAPVPISPTEPAAPETGPLSPLPPVPPSPAAPAPSAPPGPATPAPSTPQ